MKSVTCPYCPELAFARRADAVAHVESDHADKVADLLKSVRPERIANIKNPRGWAAGMLLVD